MKKRMLWLTENYPPQRGGMAQSCDRLIHHLRNAGYTIDILHFTNQGKAFQWIQQLNWRYTAAPFEESESHTLNRVWECIKDQPCDAIVCFGGYLPMLAAPIFSKWLGLPLITLLRGNDFDTSIFTPRKRDVLKDALEASAMVCTVSTDKMEKIKKLYPHVNVCYIPNGIDLADWKATPSEEQFAQEWRRQHHEKICVGIFGQLKAKKGVQFLLDSLTGSETLKQLHFLMVGELSEEIQTMLTQHEVSHTLHPFLDRFQLLKYYLCCHVVAIPSFYDGMPNVLLEAGALGVPVIASAVDGMKDVLTNKVNGLLFPSGNAAACRKAFHDLVNLSAQERAQLGINLKTIIESAYTVQHETHQYDQLCKEILGGSHDAAVWLHVR
jgi:glycogen synthase